MTQQERQNERRSILFCATKYRLIGDFIAANHELMELQNQQTQAVISHDRDFSRFDDLIHMAREIKTSQNTHLLRTQANTIVSTKIGVGRNFLLGQSALV
jgi:hypothetical protein